MNLQRFLFYLKEIGIYKTLFLNFRCLPFRKALRFPILCSRHVRIRCCDGRVVLEGFSTGIVRLGFDSVGVFDNKKSRSILEVGKGAVVTFKGKANLGNGFKLSIGRGGEFVAGDNFRLTAESTLICNKKIEIGNDCMYSWDILVMDTDFHKIYDEQGKYCNPPAAISIGNKVWLCCRTTILKGSVIPDGAVVAAGSTVSRKLHDVNSIYCGNPVASVRNGVNWEI